MSRPVSGQRLVVEPADWTVVEVLWQLYCHDLSEFRYRGMRPGADGRFGPGRLPAYVAEPDRTGYLAWRDGLPVGFALIRGVDGGPTVLGELFVIRGARRDGVGRELAEQVIARRPGTWEIAFQEENPPAARFWRSVADACFGASWHEERRPIPGKPDLSPDVWLCGLTVP